MLVAGGTGALGGAVLHELLDAGYPVTATWLEERERERVEAALGGREGLTLVRYVVDPRGTGAVQVSLCAIDPVAEDPD